MGTAESPEKCRRTAGRRDCETETRAVGPGRGRCSRQQSTSCSGNDADRCLLQHCPSLVCEAGFNARDGSSTLYNSEDLLMILKRFFILDKWRKNSQIREKLARYFAKVFYEAKVMISC